MKRRRSPMRRALIWSALAVATLASGASRADPFPYVANAFGPYFYLGDENTREGRAHFIRGQYGLAELHFRRAVDVTPQNGAAWVGLAASYDRIGRFDLADRAYRRAARLTGENAIILNNQGYSYLLRGRSREAGRLLHRAAELAPGDPTIANNITILQTGQAYFWGAHPYIWGWPP